MRATPPRPALMYCFSSSFAVSALLPLAEYWVAVQQNKHTSTVKLWSESGQVLQAHSIQVKESPEGRPKVNLAPWAHL